VREQHLLADREAALGNHATGKLFEGLIEHLLPPVGGDHAVVERYAIKRGKAAPGNTLRRGFFPVVGDETGKAAFVIALRGECRRCDDNMAPAKAAANPALIFDIGAPLVTVGL
jgi:hypothetical protein